MAVRLKDIARDLGISVITASKALRGTSDISDETRQRVLKRMAELNYRPNMLARGLASGKTFSIGLVVPDLLHPFFAEFAKALNGVLRPKNYGIVMASSEEDPELEQEEISRVLARGVDALLVASCQTKLQGFFGVQDQRTPFVLIDRDFPLLHANFIGTDDVRVGEIATGHLLDIGRRRIAHIAGPQELTPGADRLHGYRTTLRDREASVAPEYVLCNAKVEEVGEIAGHQAMQKLLGLPTPPDAVFCYNDLTAIGAMQCILEAGLTIPDDIALVGCGNVRYSDYLRVPLSSIDQSTTLLGKHAGDLVIELLGETPIRPKKLRVGPTLVIRASSSGSGS